MSVNPSLTVWDVATLTRTRDGMGHGKCAKTVLADVHLSRRYIPGKYTTTGNMDLVVLGGLLL